MKTSVASSAVIVVTSVWSTMILQLFVLVVILSTAVSVSAHELTLGLHGSGTTNPSRCYWTILETLREQTIIPLRTSYRGIGSTNGMNEFAFPFLNSSVDDATYPNFFGSGDIPITADIYKQIVNATGSTTSFVHIPVLAGTVSFFYHAPKLTYSSSSSTGKSGTPITNLNLTACLLSQIYTQQIRMWNDNAILQINPELDPVSAANVPIIVIRRAEGSSSTHAVTNVRIECLLTIAVCLSLSPSLSFHNT